MTLEVLFSLVSCDKFTDPNTRRERMRKARKKGENVTSFRGMAFVVSDMGWP